MKTIALTIGLLTVSSLILQAQRTRAAIPDGWIGDHQFVDLGLPSGTLWATCNIGAEHPTDLGDYFAWGETAPKKEYTWDTYELKTAWTGDDSESIKWDIPAMGDIAGTEYDAATVNWGQYWHLPSQEQFWELEKLCTSKKVTENGVSGTLITGPSGRSIFLPMSSIMADNGDTDFYIGKYGYYWASNPSEEEGPDKDVVGQTMADCLSIQHGEVVWNSIGSKYIGQSIRPVSSRNAIAGIQEASPGKISVTGSNGVIAVSGCIVPCSVQVADMTGKLLFSSPVLGEKITCPVSGKGIYLVSVYKNGEQVLNSKVML